MSEFENNEIPGVNPRLHDRITRRLSPHIQENLQAHLEERIRFIRRKRESFEPMKMRISRLTALLSAAFIIDIAANALVIYVISIGLGNYIIPAQYKTIINTIANEHVLYSSVLTAVSFILPILFFIVYMLPVFMYMLFKEPDGKLEFKSKSRIINIPLANGAVAVSGLILALAGTLAGFITFDYPISGQIVVIAVLNHIVLSLFCFAFVYYIMEALMRNLFLDWFFKPEEKLSHYSRVYISSKIRLIILFVSTAMMPILLLTMMLVKAMNKGPVNSTDPGILIISAIFILVGSFLSILVGNSFQHPLHELRSAADKIAAEQYEFHVKVRSNDEVGILAETFNDMSTSLMEKEFMKETFGRVVDPKVRDHLLAGNIALGGEEVRVTVLFSDIRDFTVLSEKLSPAEVVSLLNRYFDRISRCVTDEGGTVNKFIGDAIMAVFGAPVSLPDSSSCALRAALKMLEERDRLNQELLEEGIAPIKSGIGIDTGAVISGNIGSQSRMEYTVIGDTVNTASRIEGACKKLKKELLFSEDVAAQIQADSGFNGEVHKVASVQLKGKAKPVNVYTLQY